MVVEELIIKKGDKEIYGNIYYPNKEGKFPAVILSHGFNGSYSDFVTECEYYASHGFIAYSFDFCGGSVTSKSSGKTTDMTIFSEKQDLLIVLEHISNLENVEEKRIYLFYSILQGILLCALERYAKKWKRTENDGLRTWPKNKTIDRYSNHKEEA